MTKLKKLSVFFLCLICVLMTVCLFVGGVKANADTDETLAEPISIVEKDNEVIEPRGIYTSVSLSLNGGNGKIFVNL